MQQLVIEVENEGMLPSLRKILSAIDGVRVVTSRCKKKTGIDEAMEDIKQGRVYKADNVDEMFKQILG